MEKGKIVFEEGNLSDFKMASSISLKISKNYSIVIINKRDNNRGSIRI